MIKAFFIFLITYVVITGRRLNFLKIGRPAGVMVGVVLMVLSKTIKANEAYKLVNWDTILLLLGMMIVIEHLAEANFFEIIASKINKKNYNQKKLMFITVFGLGFLAGFLVNDIVCIFFTPIMILMIKKREIPPLPFLLALATSTNIGGAISFTGNPQNMIIGTMSNIPYFKFFILMLPIGITCLYVNYLLLMKMYKNSLVKEIINIDNPENIVKGVLLRRSVFITILIIIGFFIFNNIAWVAFTGATLLLVLARRDEGDILRKVDWNLLLFFTGLFIVIGGLHQSGFTDKTINYLINILDKNIISMWILGGFTVIGSNLFANVPYVLVISESIKALDNSETMWFVLAFTSTIAGNLTIIGAIANIIVVERA
ncbi:MAG: hypothetical protein GX287_04575, partial [Fusobacteria bacterium]|nr:hypothetical protein [Fusobacteriota bacterium]